ncbi:hypothetical protein ACJX0J_035671 [Zea mays]
MAGRPIAKDRYLENGDTQTMIKEALATHYLPPIKKEYIQTLINDSKIFIGWISEIDSPRLLFVFFNIKFLVGIYLQWTIIYWNRQHYILLNLFPWYCELGAGSGIHLYTLGLEQAILLDFRAEEGGSEFHFISIIIVISFYISIDLTTIFYYNIHLCAMHLFNLAIKIVWKMVHSTAPAFIDFEF